MRHTEILIIGQGIAGTLLSYELLQAGKSVLVIDMPTEHKASIVASAVINPLIGKSWTVAKDAATFIPVAVKTYKALEELLNISILAQKTLLIFHQNEQAEADFLHQVKINNPYTTLPSVAEIKQSEAQWNFQNKLGKVHTVYTVNATLLLQEWAAYLKEKSSYLEERFSFDELVIQDGTIFYKDIRADKIIFCEGATGRNNPFFPGQNFTANRGDVLLLSIAGLSPGFLYQKEIRLVPKNDGLFWCGSNYTWKYKDLNPDLTWQNETLIQLKNWLKLPFELSGHFVAERPTIAGQAPILLQHQEYKQLFFFNGLGTRGFSAGPSLARKMMELIIVMKD